MICSKSGQHFFAGAGHAATAVATAVSLAFLAADLAYVAPAAEAWTVAAKLSAYVQEILCVKRCSQATQ